MDTRKKDQFTCFVNDDNGWAYMDSFDHLDPAIRERMRYATVNICAACILMHSGSVELALNWIEFVEDQVRRKYGDQV